MNIDPSFGAKESTDKDPKSQSHLIFKEMGGIDSAFGIVSSKALGSSKSWNGKPLFDWLSTTSS